MTDGKSTLVSAHQRVYVCQRSHTMSTVPRTSHSSAASVPASTTVSAVQSTRTAAEDACVSERCGGSSCSYFYWWWCPCSAASGRPRCTVFTCSVEQLAYAACRACNEWHDWWREWRVGWRVRCSGMRHDMSVCHELYERGAASSCTCSHAHCDTVRYPVSTAPAALDLITDFTSLAVRLSPCSVAAPRLCVSSVHANEE